MENLYSTITARETQETKTVQITNSTKPEIIGSVIFKWQLLIDTVAKAANVPSGLIMKLNEDTIEVFMQSKTDGNPYKVGGKEKLVYGLYCENVIATQKPLLVPDATKSKVWKDNNPDIDINMKSYLGYPINWPDGVVFGTICLLDNKENRYNELLIQLLEQSKLHIETDLQLLSSEMELKEANEELEKMNGIKSRFLSLITHDIRGGLSTIDEFIKLTIENFESLNKQDLKRNLKLMGHSTSKAYMVLENLLSWSKKDILELKPDKKQISMVDLIENTLAYFSQAFSIKELKLIKDYGDEEVIITADENMMLASLRNILSNAIKFTDNEGTIFIRLQKENNKLIIEVEDTGVGIPADKLNDIFNPDTKYHQKGTKGESSAGIGLLITKEFLEKNGAVLKVESEEGKGTKVRVVI